MHKRLVQLERQCWRKRQYPRDECIETFEIPNNTPEEKVCKLVSSETGVNINPESLKFCHCLPCGQQQNHRKLDTMLRIRCRISFENDYLRSFKVSLLTLSRLIPTKWEISKLHF